MLEVGQVGASTRKRGKWAKRSNCSAPTRAGPGGSVYFVYFVEFARASASSSQGRTSYLRTRAVGQMFPKISQGCCERLRHNSRKLSPKAAASAAESEIGDCRCPLWTEACITAAARLQI